MVMKEKFDFKKFLTFKVSAKVLDNRSTSFKTTSSTQTIQNVLKQT